MKIILSFLIINLSNEVYTQFNNNNINRGELVKTPISEVLETNANLFKNIQAQTNPINNFAITQNAAANFIQNQNIINPSLSDIQNFVTAQLFANGIQNSNTLIHLLNVNNNTIENAETSQKSIHELKKSNPFIRRAIENFDNVPEATIQNPTLAINSPLENFSTFQYQYNREWSAFENLTQQIQNFIKPNLINHQSVQYFEPNIPDSQYYQNFYNIYNFVENHENANLSQNEMDSINDDFNGRSIVAPGQYPHMAAVGFLSNEDQIEFKCGGSLISDSFVITAAHCCYLNGDTPVLVKLGIINLKNEKEDFTPQNRQISDIILHPSYNSSMHYHDIALLKLQKPVEFTKFVRPIRLWASDDIPYEHVFTMGYGSTSFAKAPTNILTELDLSLISWQKCKQALPKDEKTPQGIMETQICAKDLEKNRDTCQGDSGGPLQLNLERRRRRNRYRFYLVGIISYGEFCRSKHPGVYTRISSYCHWIASIVWPEYFEDFE